MHSNSCTHTGTLSEMGVYFALFALDHSFARCIHYEKLVRLQLFAQCRLPLKCFIFMHFRINAMHALYRASVCVSACLRVCKLCIYSFDLFCMLIAFASVYAATACMCVCVGVCVCRAAYNLSHAVHNVPHNVATIY